MPLGCYLPVDVNTASQAQLHLDRYFVFGGLTGTKHCSNCSSPPGIDEDDACFIDNFLALYAPALTGFITDRDMAERSGWR